MPESAERPAGKETEGAAEKPAKTKGEKAKKPIKNVELRNCLCGCGSPSKSRFLPGHDARLHGLVLRIFRGKASQDELPATPATREYLKTAPWMTDGIRTALGLAS